MRRKGNPPPPMDESAETPNETMDEGGHGEDQGNSAGDDATTILPKSVGGGKQWKPGDEIVLKIVAVDPESGDMQAKYAPEKGGEEDEPADSMEAMDQSMPESGGGY